MEEFKIELFQKEYKSKFPNFIQLSHSKCSKFSKKLMKNFDLNSLDIEKELYEKQNLLNHIDASEGFSILETLSDHNIDYDLKLFINWSKFILVDVFSAADFENYFYDIWYPIADDIDVFDKNCNWIISIRHDGYVSLIKADGLSR